MRFHPSEFKSILPGSIGTSQGLRVYDAADFRVSNGANLGDPVAQSSEVMLDDIYQLSPDVRPRRLALSATGGLSDLHVAESGQVGTVHAPVHLDSCLTFMAPDGSLVEAIVLIELEPGTDLIAATWLLPLAELQSRTDYALIELNTDRARDRFASLACVSFTRGTQITMASGEQRPIENITVGDRVLTRDSGIQQVRWIGQQTVRATGAFAPIRIAKGAMNNSEDLHLSPNQRLFVYQRRDRLKAGQAEVMIKAELLVNGDTVTRSDGGFVEYHQILFDNHEFIFAEGIATESLTLDGATSPALPDEVLNRVSPVRASRSRPTPIDLPEGLLDAGRAVDVLRRVSSYG